MNINEHPSLFRIPPNMPPEAYKTYTVQAPADTHWRSATCEEVNCESFTYGFTVAVDETMQLGQRQAHYMRHDKTRSHKEERSGLGLTVFIFPSGTKCFAADTHKIQVRPDKFLVFGGDYRGNPMGIATICHTKPEYWVEDFAENQQKLADLIERG